MKLSPELTVACAQVDHDLPSQCTVNVLSEFSRYRLFLPPRCHHSRSPRGQQRATDSPPGFGFGLGTAVQLMPSQCAVSVFRDVPGGSEPSHRPPTYHFA